ncbi:unnamed protein product [Cuscuta epithymum]|uniref:Myb-like domain-containing protein n=1 Tax=Cuscuta epithymum TaxID=186058 RepID=A0AAV0DHD2_9ASTE|nr:unnamed protein product [Cuscuta epithymum]
MTNKRPFDDEVVYEGNPKHHRQDKHSADITSCNESYSKGGLCEKNYGLGRELAGEANMGKSDVTRSVSLSHWTTSSCTSDEDELPEDTFQSPFFPGYFTFGCSARPAINPDDSYNCLLDYPPRKQVPVGPDHQAVIPCWNPQETYEGELGGIPVLPNPETDEKVMNGWTKCTCPDEGSIRCVRQHVAEARDKLRRTFGPATFTELGFDEMGEVVADKWSKEEEELFDEIVYSNPASMGKNFWNTLSTAFPSKTKMEIVSYYFNVNMLRKRAEQNRWDPLNIDSDNDEWQGESDNDESTIQDGLDFPQKQHCHESEDDDEDLSDEGPGRNSSDFDPSFESPGMKKSVDGGETGLQDGGGSCTSSDSGVQGGPLKPDNGSLEWNGYNLESSDGKTMWDVYNVSCPKFNFDFLPTCSMIEEIFGEGDFDSKGKRW